jgi:hypothetical protein
MDCLESLLGLAAAPVPCFPFPQDETRQAAITFTTSGYYLADVEGFPSRPSQSVVNSAPSDFYDRLAQARRAGAGETRTQLLKGLAGKYSSKTLWRGPLGKPDYTETAPEGQPAHMVLQTKNIPGAVFRLDTVMVSTIPSVANLVVTLDGEEVGTLASSNQAGLSLPIDIPLDGKTHRLEAVLPAGTRARINKLCCVGCGACSGPDLILTQVGGNVQGFSVTGKVECLPEALDLLCYAAAVDENGTPRLPIIQPVLAQAVRHASAHVYCRNLLAALAAGSRYVDLTPEQLDDQAVFYEKKFNEHITWLIGSTAMSGITDHPCYYCEQGGKLTMVKSY